MWLEAFNRRLNRRFHYAIWLVAILGVIAALLIQWHQVNEKAEQVQLRMLVQTFYKSASSLRQQWELQGKPEQARLDGLEYTFTRFGWPKMVLDGEIDCQKTWDLLASREEVISYVNVFNKNISTTKSYGFCYYKIYDGKWLELFYENETIHIDGFLTD